MCKSVVLCFFHHHKGYILLPAPTIHPNYTYHTSICSAFKPICSPTLLGCIFSTFLHLTLCSLCCNFSDSHNQNNMPEHTFFLSASPAAPIPLHYNSCMVFDTSIIFPSNPSQLKAPSFHTPFSCTPPPFLYCSGPGRLSHTPHVSKPPPPLNLLPARCTYDIEEERQKERAQFVCHTEIADCHLALT